MSRGNEKSILRAEISFDLVAEDDMEFEEGSYRVLEQDWRVFVFSKEDVPEMIVKPTKWDSGATGLKVRFPASKRLNRSSVQQVLSEALGVKEWISVNGPDSLRLR